MKKHLPNLLTLLNLFSGIIALKFALEQEFQWTLLWIAIGITFDFFDGFFARALKVTSPLGLQLDSLADMVTSGLVPGQVMYWLISYDAAHYGSLSHFYLPFVGYLVTLASAYRLARFNIDARQAHGFIGLPTPANALLITSIGVIVSEASYISALPLWATLSLTVLSCYLLNSNIPLLALKFKDFSWKHNAMKYIYLLLSVLLLLIFKVTALPMIILAYILLSILQNQLEKKNH
nr:CDP-alcohol phosphatidyltransferase family protein [uncultured Capnocytophaga sp.]